MKRERPHEVRRGAEQRAPLAARLEHEAEVAVLEVAHAAVDEPRRAARGAAREVVALDERDAEAAERGVARDAGAGDPAADDEEVDVIAGEPVEDDRARWEARSERSALRRRRRSLRLGARAVRRAPGRRRAGGPRGRRRTSRRARRRLRPPGDRAGLRRAGGGTRGRRVRRGVMGVVADAGALPLAAGTLDALLTVNFLDRSLFPHLARLLRPGGRLIVETYTTGHATLVEQGRAHGPRNRAYLLEPGEILALVAPLVVLVHEEGMVDDGTGARHVARIVAERAEQ